MSFTLWAQPKWVYLEPVSESGRYDYFVGEGSSRDDAFLDALEALATQRGLVGAEFTTEKKKKIVDDLVSSEFETTSKVEVGKKDLIVFKVRKWNDGDIFYALIGSPTKGSSTDGGIMAKSQFIWRSALLPGWGQFYNKQPTKGLAFSLGEVGLIGATIFSFSQAASQQDQADLARLNGNIAQWNTHDQNAKSWRTTGTIFGVGAGALWLLNIIDATASEKNLYVFNDRKVKVGLLAYSDQVGFKLQF